MTTEEIDNKLNDQRAILELKYSTAREIRRLLEEAESKLEAIGEDYDESEILDLVTDDA